MFPFSSRILPTEEFTTAVKGATNIHDEITNSTKPDKPPRSLSLRFLNLFGMNNLNTKYRSGIKTIPKMTITNKKTKYKTNLITEREIPAAKSMTSLEGVVPASIKEFVIVISTNSPIVVAPFNESTAPIFEAKSVIL